MRLAAAALVLAACGKHADPPDDERAKALYDIVPLDIAPGESDLALDGRQHLWSIAERDRVITEIELGPPVKLTTHPLDGIRDGLDTEALAWLDATHLVIGTEGQVDPTASVVYAELGSDGRIVAKSERQIASADAGVELTKNHGIEAMCGAGDELVVAIESVGIDAKGRWTPLLRFHGDAVTLARWRLTTEAGKISAMACSFGADGSIEILAIERHYGVSRIVRGVVALGAAEIAPTVELDLFPINHDRYNLEGIVVKDHRWILINDNQGARVGGPTQLFLFHPR